MRLNCLLIFTATIILFSQVIGAQEIEFEVEVIINEFEIPDAVEEDVVSPPVNHQETEFEVGAVRNEEDITIAVEEAPIGDAGPETALEIEIVINEEAIIIVAEDEVVIPPVNHQETEFEVEVVVDEYEVPPVAEEEVVTPPVNYQETEFEVEVVNGEAEIIIDVPEEEPHEEEDATPIQESPLVEKLVGFWTAPSFDPLSGTPEARCCIPDNVIITRIPSSSLLNVTYKFTSTNIQCQTMYSTANQGIFSASPSAGYGVPNPTLSGEFVTNFVGDWIYSEFTRSSFKYGLAMGTSHLFNYLRVSTLLISGGCSFYMTEKKIDVAEQSFETPSMMLAADVSSSSGDSKIIDMDEIYDSKQKNTALIITSVGFGVMSIAVVVLSVLLYLRKKEMVLKRKATDDVENNFIAQTVSSSASIRDKNF